MPPLQLYGTQVSWYLAVLQNVAEPLCVFDDGVWFASDVALACRCWLWGTQRVCCTCSSCPERCGVRCRMRSA
jgi:hypothetical protein